MQLSAVYFTEMMAKQFLPLKSINKTIIKKHSIFAASGVIDWLLIMPNKYIGLVPGTIWPSTNDTINREHSPIWRA
jgi:hypothetical protein